VLATEGDLGHPREVVRLAEELTSSDAELTPARIGDVHINIARAQLDLGDRDGAQTSLVQAWDLHRRSNPQLVQLAKRAGLAE
jgi:uncharacterized protein HemY